MNKTLDIFDSFPLKYSVKQENKDMVLSDSGEVKTGTTLICTVSATHSGTLINNRIYPPASMQKGIKSWTSPYKKPVLVNHDEERDPVGRVIKAKYIKTPRGMDGKEYVPILKPSDGYGYIELTVKITDQEAIQKILDGRYETVSVRMGTDKALCSICNADWGSDGPCEHFPGQKYDGKLAYITTGDLSYREVSFVNIPADEFAKVEGGRFEDNSNEAVEIKMYANNTEEKVLCDLGDSKRNNLYEYLKDEYDEDEDVVVHLIDSANKKQMNSKEDQMSKDKELTKDQLMEMDSVKELIQEAKDATSKSCEDQLNKLKEECEKMSKDSKESGDNKDEKDVESLSEKLNAAIDAQTALSKEKEALTQERDQLKDELGKIEEERKTILDENVGLNTELHRLNAERLFDLKSELKKPDIAGVKTMEDRDKKVEEFAQRSIDSLKDQINDLIIEKNAAPESLKPMAQVQNPGIVREDSGEPKVKTNKKETKGETLKRLFDSKRTN